MSNLEGGAESEEVISKELDDKSALGGAEGEQGHVKASKPEEPTASGGESRTEPIVDLSITREEQNMEVLYANLQGGQEQEHPYKRKSHQQTSWNKLEQEMQEDLSKNLPG